MQIADEDVARGLEQIFIPKTSIDYEGESICSCCGAYTTAIRNLPSGVDVAFTRNSKVPKDFASYSCEAKSSIFSVDDNTFMHMRFTKYTGKKAPGQWSSEYNGCSIDLATSDKFVFLYVSGFLKALDPMSCLWLGEYDQNKLPKYYVVKDHSYLSKIRAYLPGKEEALELLKKKARETFTQKYAVFIHKPEEQDLSKAIDFLGFKETVFQEDFCNRKYPDIEKNYLTLSIVETGN